MSRFFQDVDARMRRAVQQENRSLSSSLSTDKKAKPSSQGKCGLLLIMLSPMLFILLILYVLNMYNAMVAYDQQQQQKLLQQAQVEDQERRQQQEQQMLRKRQADVARISARSSSQTLVLTTELGPIRIGLRPDLSQGSVDYIHKLVESGVCRRCIFYRAEKPGILQGVMANKDIPTNEVLGPCPSDSAQKVENDCPEWDPDCGCHGPVMTRGGVAWAGGDPGGPDFFIDAYKNPAKWWGTQHTNFGFIEDPASMAIVDQILNLPVKKSGGMSYLNDHIPFSMTIE